MGAELVSHGMDVGAVRVSAGGWEGWVLEGLQVSASDTPQVPRGIPHVRAVPRAYVGTWALPGCL